MTREASYKDDIDEVNKLLTAGLSVREVAMKTGYSKSAIGRARRKLYGRNGEPPSTDGENDTGAAGAVDKGLPEPNQEVR
jgi:hypothetical protein